MSLLLNTYIFILNNSMDKKEWKDLSKFEKHSAVVERFGEKFCASPWNSFHEGPQGLVSTCCKTRSPIGYSHKQTFEEMYNSDHAKSVRADFLAGKWPAQCKECWKTEVDGIPAMNRVHGNAMSTLENLETLVSATEADGTLHEHKPEWLDLLWTSKCNFACMGCSPELSSTIHNKYRSAYALLDTTAEEEYHSNMTEWENGSTHKVDYVLKHADTIRSIHLNGGEPWMSENTYELLEEMLKRGLNKKIQIWSHTNGSITKGYKGVDIIEDYLVHWGQNAKVTMSNDGFGSVGEYTRYGYRDAKWLETYAKVAATKIEITIQTCWNMFNAPTIHELGEWFVDNCAQTEQQRSGLHDRPDGSLTLWANSTLNPNMLWYFPEVKDRAIASLKQCQRSGAHPIHWKENLPRWINYLEGDSQKSTVSKLYSSNDYKLLTYWYKGINEMDRLRSTDLKTSVPALADFYDFATEIVTKTDQTPNHTS